MSTLSHYSRVETTAHARSRRNREFPLNRKSTSEERNICSLKMSIRLGVLSVRIVPVANYVLSLLEEYKERRRFGDDAIS